MMEAQRDDGSSADERYRKQAAVTPTRLFWWIGLSIAYRLMTCYWFIWRPTTYGAYVAIWWGERLLLIRNSYKAQQTFPAGGAKRGESLRDAAVREVREEVGVKLLPDMLVSLGMYHSLTEYKLDWCEVFEVRLDDQPDIQIDGREVVDAEFVAVGDLPQRKLTSIVQQYIADRRCVTACE